MNATTRGKTVETPIAYWDPTTKKGGRLVVWRKVTTIGERTTTTFSFRGDGCSGGIVANDDATAIDYVARTIVPMQCGKLRRVM